MFSQHHVDQLELARTPLGKHNHKSTATTAQQAPTTSNSGPHTQDIHTKSSPACIVRVYMVG